MAEAHDRRTVVLRDWPATWTYAGGGVAFAALTVGCFVYMQHWLMGLLGLLTGLLSAAGFRAVFRSSHVSDCPACGGELKQLSGGRNDPQPCPHCRKFVEGGNGVLWAVEPERVGQEHDFFTFRPERFVFPNTCCVCGAGATRYEALEDDQDDGPSSATLVAELLAGEGVTTEGVPYCEECTDGVRLPSEGEVRFRSYPYLRAFCEVNRIQPGPEPEFVELVYADVAELSGDLRDSDPERRRSAAEALGYKGLAGLDAVPQLIRALRDEDEDVRHVASASLRRLDPDGRVTARHVPQICGRPSTGGEEPPESGQEAAAEEAESPAPA